MKSARKVLEEHNAREERRSRNTIWRLVAYARAARTNTRLPAQDAVHSL